MASPDWFCDTPQEKDQDLRLAIQTCWIYELAEVESITGRRQAGALKAMLSSSTDTFRVPYGSATERHPRPSILVASCNRDDFLRDETGSRRFWVIEIPRPIDHGRVADDRDRIWKAALIAYRQGRLPLLSAEEQEASNRRNGGYETEDPWLAMLSAWVAGRPLRPCLDEAVPPRLADHPFSTAGALIAAGCRPPGQISRADETRVAPLLRSLGFVKDQHQTHGPEGKVRRWRRVPTQAASSAPTNDGADPNRDAAGDSGLLPQPLNVCTGTMPAPMGSSSAAGGEHSVEPLGQSAENPVREPMASAQPHDGCPEAPPRHEASSPTGTHWRITARLSGRRLQISNGVESRVVPQDQQDRFGLMA